MERRRRNGIGYLNKIKNSTSRIIANKVNIINWLINFFKESGVLGFVALEAHVTNLDYILFI